MLKIVRVVREREREEYQSKRGSFVWRPKMKRKMKGEELGFQIFERERRRQEGTRERINGANTEVHR